MSQPIPVDLRFWNRLLSRPTRFPNLAAQYNSCFQVDPATDRYNCISWAVQDLDNWLDLPQVVAGQGGIDGFLALYHLERCLIDDPNMRVRVYHYVPDLEFPYGHMDRFNATAVAWERGDVYGDPGLFYRLTAEANVMAPAVIEAEPLSGLELRLIGDWAESHASKNVVMDPFETLFAAWKATWFQGTTELAQNSRALCQGTAWKALVAFGTRTNILPQIVNKLKDTSNMFAVGLYNTLQKDASKKVSPDDLKNFYVLNNQAIAIQRLNLKSITEIHD